MLEKDSARLKLTRAYKHHPMLGKLIWVNHAYSSNGPLGPISDLLQFSPLMQRKQTPENFSSIKQSYQKL